MDASDLIALGLVDGTASVTTPVCCENTDKMETRESDFVSLWKCRYFKFLK